MATSVVFFALLRGARLGTNCCFAHPLRRALRARFARAHDTLLPRTCASRTRVPRALAGTCASRTRVILPSSGPVLDQFWASAGPAVDQFWASSGPALRQFWISPGPVLGRFWAGSGPVLGRFWAGSGPVLGRFRAGSGPVLGRFWAGSGPVLGRFWTGSGPVLDRFWAGSGPVLGRFWAGSGPVLGQFWAGSGPVLGRFWAGSGPVLGRFWASSGPVLGRFWAGSRPVLGQFWAGSGPVLGRVRASSEPVLDHSGPVLGLFWASSGPVLGRFWAGSEPVLCQFWAGSGPVPGRFRAGSGPVLGRFWASSGPVLDRFWAGSGPVLGRFRAGSGPVLGRFWAGSGPVLGRFWTGSGPVLGRFWAGSGPVLDRFWAGSGPVLGRFWASSGPVLGRFWASSGPVLGQFWAGSGPVLGRFWPVLGQFWTSSGPVLGRFWAGSGSVLGQFWAGSGPVLVRFWASCGPVLGRFWTGSGPVLGRFWAGSGPVLSHSGPVLGRFWAGSGPVLGRFWAGSGPVLCQFWISSGPVLGRFRAGSGPVLGRFWAGSGPVLGRFWTGSGPVLGRFWAGSGPVPGRFWAGSGPVLGRFWTGSGPVLDRFWTGSGPVLDRFWAGSGPVLGRVWARPVSGSVLGRFWAGSGPGLGRFWGGSGPVLDQYRAAPVAVDAAIAFNIYGALLLVHDWPAKTLDEVTAFTKGLTKATLHFATRACNEAVPDPGDDTVPATASNESTNVPSKQRQRPPLIGEENERNVVIHISRMSFEAWLPWGLRLDPDTMELRRCTKGSAALHRGATRGCVGMVLEAVDGRPVATPQEASEALGENVDAWLTFLSAGHAAAPAAQDDDVPATETRAQLHPYKQRQRSQPPHVEQEHIQSDDVLQRIQEERMCDATVLDMQQQGPQLLLDNNVDEDKGYVQGREGAPDESLQHAGDDERGTRYAYMSGFLEQACPGVSQRLLQMWAEMLSSAGLDSRVALEAVRSVDDLPDEISLYARNMIAASCFQLRARTSLEKTGTQRPASDIEVQSSRGCDPSPPIVPSRQQQGPLPSFVEQGRSGQQTKHPPLPVDHGPGSARRGPVLVTMLRRIGVDSYIMGMTLHPTTLVLNGCIPGSAAARNAQIRGCIGMVLAAEPSWPGANAAVNGTQIRRKTDIGDAVEGRQLLEFHFIPAPITNDANVLNKYGQGPLPLPVEQGLVHRDSRTSSKGNDVSIPDEEEVDKHARRKQRQRELVSIIRGLEKDVAKAQAQLRNAKKGTGLAKALAVAVETKQSTLSMLRADLSSLTAHEPHSVPIGNEIVLAENESLPDERTLAHKDSSSSSSEGGDEHVPDREEIEHQIHRKQRQQELVSMIHGLEKELAKAQAQLKNAKKGSVLAKAVAVTVQTKGNIIATLKDDLSSLNIQITAHEPQPVHISDKTVLTGDELLNKRRQGPQPLPDDKHEREQGCQSLPVECPPGGNGVVVELTRRPEEKDLHSGMIFRKGTMQLIDCEAGSITHRSEQIAACVGMVLTEVNGLPVHCPLDEEMASEGRIQLRLCFVPMGTPELHGKTAAGETGALSKPGLLVEKQYSDHVIVKTVNLERREGSEGLPWGFYWAVGKGVLQLKGCPV
eukprot:gene57450-biopygen16642